MLTAGDKKQINFVNGIARIIKNGQWCFINEKRKTSKKYDFCFTIHSDIMRATKNEKLCFVNKNFKQSSFYDYCYDFTGDYGLAEKNNEWFFVDKQFKEFKLKKIYGIAGRDRFLSKKKRNKKYIFPFTILIDNKGFVFCLNYENAQCYFDWNSKFYEVEIDIDKLEVDHDHFYSNNIKFIRKLTRANEQNFKYKFIGENNE
jgi:hypothetical protein